uniref:Uncharacterized protein n=1 Tax=Peronospora matthiolae TaxID=2874970 RepID=A0AAV1UUH5_9STRA
MGHKLPDSSRTLGRCKRPRVAERKLDVKVGGLMKGVTVEHKCAWSVTERLILHPRLAEEEFYVVNVE